MNKFLLLVILSGVVLLSCSNNVTHEEKIREWQNKTIYIPKDIKKVHNGNQEYINKIYTSDLKILTYIDSFNCTPCKLKFLKWKQLIADCHTLDKDICFMFFINSKNYREIDSIAKATGFDEPLIYDKKDKLNKMNKFPKEPILQAFLLDKEDKILIVGNPVYDEAIWELYLKVIKSQ